MINDRDVPAYLSHVERRLREENERLLHYLDTSSKWQLIHTVEKQLISEHLASILNKGLDSLLEENRCPTSFYERPLRKTTKFNYSYSILLTFAGNQSLGLCTPCLEE